MTYRNDKLKKKKNQKINYTLDITQNLPRPNYTKLKSKFQREPISDALESQLKAQVKAIKDNIELKDNAFIDSLKRATGQDFIEKLKPVLKRHQKIFEPSGASSSRNPLLLRNTFNIDIYNAFLMQKR